MFRGVGQGDRLPPNMCLLLPLHRAGTWRPQCLVPQILDTKDQKETKRRPKSTPPLQVASVSPTPGLHHPLPVPQLLSCCRVNWGTRGHRVSPGTVMPLCRQSAYASSAVTFGGRLERGFLLLEDFHNVSTNVTSSNTSG